MRKTRRRLTLSPLAATLLLCACQAAERHADFSLTRNRQTEVRSDAKTELAVPHIRQETLLCVPTSAAMILAYYGDVQSPRRLKALAAGGDYRPGAPFNDYSITLYRDLVRAVGSLGYEWREFSLPDTSAGFADGLALIESEVHNGRPVLVDVSAPEGHTFVVAGFERDGRRLLVVDPDREAPGRRWIGFDDFQAVWNEHAYGGGFRSLLATQPRPAG